MTSPSVPPRDKYERRPPKGALAMTRSVAEALGAAQREGVESVTPDLHDPEIVHVVCTPAARRLLMADSGRFFPCTHVCVVPRDALGRALRRGEE